MSVRILSEPDSSGMVQVELGGYLVRLSIETLVEWGFLPQSVLDDFLAARS